MNTFFPMKQVKIILLVCVIIAVGIIIIFPKFDNAKSKLERATYCDGYVIQAKKNDPTIDLKSSYEECVKNYVKP